MGGGHLGAWEVSPHTRTCMRMHAHTHTHLYMYRNCKWPPTWRHPCLACLACLACLTCMCVRVCMRVYVCACVHAWDMPPHTHTQLHPHPPISHPPRGVDPRNHLKFNNTSTYQDISIPFKDLKFMKNFPPMGGCVVWWVGGWLGGLMGGVRSNH